MDNHRTDFQYDSKDRYYKEPFGALRSDGEARIRVRVRGGGAAFSLYFVLQEDGKEAKLLPMRPLGPAGEWDEYEVKLQRLAPGLYWYWFRKDAFGGSACFGEEKPWQLTVYDKDYKTPDWLDAGVVYHIFVDRFNRVGPKPEPKRGRDFKFHENWGDTPDLYPEGQVDQNYDFFGGNLQGILEKLDYLQSLGVRTLYLSPIFEAASSHRYDAGDYMKVDPIAGTEEDFRRLCAEAAGRGMRVLLDVAFNHTGSDSRYFNNKELYDTTGAAQSKDSPFYSWYTFRRWPDDYACWWNVKTLPEADKQNEDYINFTLESKDSVAKHWLRAGASGYRLDVADELPQEYLERLRTACKIEKPDAAVIGEVWEDATNKVSYGVRRRYFLGRELDGVTNYPAGKAIVKFVSGETNAAQMANALLTLHENCPPPALRCLMNAVGSHDTQRILNVLGCAPEAFTLSKREKAAYRLSSDEREKGRRILKLVSALQYMLPGAPCLYYGDEAGVEGFEDPLSRRTYPWGGEDGELLAWYRTLGNMRIKYREVFTEGSLEIETAGGDVAAVSRRLGGRSIWACANRGEVAYKPPWDLCFEVLAGGIDRAEGVPKVPPHSALVMLIH